MKTEIQHIESGRPARSGQLILQRRHEIVSKYLRPQNPSHCLLDIGCGNGAQTAYFLEDFDLTVGCDLIHPNQTEGPVRDERLHFVQCEIEALPFPEAKFDSILAFEVLEHVRDDRAAVRKIEKVLKPGGLFIFSVPNRWWVFETHGANVPGFNFVPWNRVPLVSWLPTGLHDRIAKARIYTISKAVNLVSSTRFRVIDSGYITAPLDVLPEGALRKLLRETVFSDPTTSNPFLAVNLFLVCQKA